MPIGGPLANLHCYVLDEHLQLLPVGVPGELMVSGIQVARGYIKRPDLTAEKFIANPFAGGDPHHGRMYRTGASRTPLLRFCLTCCWGICLRRLRPRLLRAVRTCQATWRAGCLMATLDFVGRIDNQVRHVNLLPLQL